MSQNARTKILPLESLRGLCAIAIVLHHFRPNSFLADNAFIHNAVYLVDFFFVLSGFVIMLSYHSKIKSVTDIVKFQKRRFWRLWPLHFAMLMVFVGFECIKYFLQLKGYEASSPAFSNNNLTAFINNFFLTQSIIPEHTSFNFPSWSISVEFYTYIIFAFALLYSGKHMGKVALVILILSALVLFYYNVAHPITRLSMFRCTYSFFAGVIVYLIYKRTRIHSYPTAVILLTVAIVALISYDLPARATLVFTPLFSIFILLVISLDGESVISRVMSRKQLVHLGTLSYSIYMVHLAVLWVMTNTLRYLLRVPASLDSEAKVALHLSEPILTLLAILAVLLSLMAAQLTYTFIENKFRKR